MKRYIKSSTTSGLVGIWWIYNDQVVADVKTLDEGYNDGNYINYDEIKNHQTEWRRLITQYIPKNASELVLKGYKCIERGRVIYNLRTQCYEVICSEPVFNSESDRQLLLDAFDLKGCRYDFVPLHHYFKLELTGNPAIDSIYYDF